MSNEQDESNTAPPATTFIYQQDRGKSAELYLKEKLSDVNFLFSSDDGTVTRIPSHKMFLATYSDVFEKMLFGELKETGDVTIVDASAVAFKAFLQFFYLSEVKLSADHIAEVMYLGHKYNVEECIKGCAKTWENYLTDENVCTTLSLAMLYDQKQLVKACETRILLNTAGILKSADILESSKDALGYILRMNLLSCSEVDLFEACMAWVQFKGKKNPVSKAMVDEHLGELYYEIRFTSMTGPTFCALEEKYKDVLSGDFNAIIKLILQPEKTSDRFNTAPRVIKWNESGTISLDRDKMDKEILKYCPLGFEEETTFSSNKHILFGAFSCNYLNIGGSNGRPIKRNVTAEVEITEKRSLDDADEKILSNPKAIFICDEGDYNYPNVLLPHPILIRPGFFYIIRIKGFPEEHFFQSYPQSKNPINLNSSVTIEFHNDRIFEGQATGLIYGLEFNEI